MSRTDLGLILVLGTYAVMFGFIGYQGFTYGFKDLVEVAYVPGKNPILFIINLILYLAGSYLILDSFRGDVDRVNEAVDILFFIVPSVNIISAFLYLIAVSGGEGLIEFGTEVYFILMYNVILYIIGVSLLVRRIDFTKLPKEILGYIGILILYVVIRLSIGVIPAIQFIILLLIIGYTYYIIRYRWPRE